MPSFHFTSQGFPFLAQFPARDRQMAERASKRLADAERKAGQARAQKTEEIAARVERQLTDVLGVEGVAELRSAMDRGRLAYRAGLEPPGGVLVDRDKANRARKRRVNSLLRRLGMNPNDLRGFVTEAKAELDDVLTTPPGTLTDGFNLTRNLEKWLALSDLHEYALPWGVAPPDKDEDPHRWFLHRPPFFGFDFKFEFVSTSHFVVDREHVVDPPAGLVGNVARMTCSNPSDFDAAHVIVETHIAFGFVPPVNGRMQVLVDARSNVATHDLRTENEWGFSTSWTNQNNYLAMRVLHPDVPEPQLALMSNFYRETDEDENHHVENLTQGQHYFAVFTTPNPVRGGQHLVIEVGTRSFDITRADDVEIYSRTDFQWSISSVEVRILP